MNRLGYERIRRSLVSVLDHRDNVHHRSLRSGVIACQLHETDQFFSKKCPYEEAGFLESRTHPLYSFNVFAIVRKRLSLSERALVVYFPDPSYESVIEGY